MADLRVFTLSENGCVDHWAAAETVHEALRYFADAIRDQGSDIDNPSEEYTVKEIATGKLSLISWHDEDDSGIDNLQLLMERGQAAGYIGCSEW